MLWDLYCKSRWCTASNPVINMFSLCYSPLSFSELWLKWGKKSLSGFPDVLNTTRLISMTEPGACSLHAPGLGPELVAFMSSSSLFEHVVFLESWFKVSWKISRPTLQSLEYHFHSSVQSSHIRSVQMCRVEKSDGTIALIVNTWSASCCLPCKTLENNYPELFLTSWLICLH